MSKERILVVEDEEDILALVHYNLVKAGFIVDTAASGEEGLQKALQVRPVSTLHYWGCQLSSISYGPTKVR